jgi:pectin acetylesterase
MKRFAIIIAGIILAINCFAQINIWENTECHKKVKLTPYIVNGNNNIGIVVCPGGSYFWHDSETEGHEVSKWLNKNGISAFVLDYRTAYVPAFIFHHRYLFRGNRYPDPQNDLRQAIKLVRKNASEFGVDTTKIGAMGFSAGGHLVMSSAELFAPIDRPNFIVPIYPVVTMTEDCVHKRSRRGLLGDNKQNDPELKDLLSLERHVQVDCPPVFLVNCKDDPIVDYRNSMLLDSALTSKNIPHQYLLYETGGHGFGASETKGTAECREWKEAFLNWIKTIF